MKVARRELLQLAMGAAPLSILLAFSDSIAWSQNLSTVRFIVPFPAGGGLDLLARVLAQQIAQETGLTIVVENRPGAASIIGAEYVSRAAPDGNTVLLVGNALVIHPFFKKLNYDPLTSFAPISLLAISPQVIVVNPASPYRTLGDLIDAARAKPGQLTNASVGPATSQHIAWELLKLRSKIKMIYVPFKGNAPAVNDMLGGHIDSLMDNYSVLAENIQAGRLRPLAVGSRARLKWLPNVPTVAESGYPGYEASVWFGLLAPSGTPSDVIDQLSRWCNAAMLAPELKPKWDLQGLEPIGNSPADFAAYLRQQQEEFGRVIREANIQAS